MTFRFAKTPEPPYFAVIFTSMRTAVDDGYGGVADRMVELTSQLPGFLGKAQGEHRVAQSFGHKKWYEHFEVRVARVERAYRGPNMA